MNVHGIAFQRDWVFLATDRQLYRASVSALGEFQALSPITNDLPESCSEPHRGLGVGPDSMLYVSVGADCASAETANPEHGALLRAGIDGKGRTVFASGLRKTLGFGWHPDTGELWGMDEGSGLSGGKLPPEELNRLEQGADYGYPYCFGAGEVAADAASPPQASKEDHCAGSTPSLLDHAAQGGALGFTFYSGTAFPSEYRGDAFVTLHGSWNQAPAAGYSVVRIRFDDGKPVGFEDFVTGFLMGGTAQFGRPAGVTTAADGSLLFSDDQNGVVYRVTHNG
jgi:glucose/arabinose dehydrogenase